MEFNKPEGYKSINNSKSIVINKKSYSDTVKLYFHKLMNSISYK
jgi:hypothetical protein